MNHLNFVFNFIFFFFLYGSGGYSLHAPLDLEDFSLDAVTSQPAGKLSGNCREIDRKRYHGAVDQNPFMSNNRSIDAGTLDEGLPHQLHQNPILFEGGKNSFN